VSRNLGIAARTPQPSNTKDLVLEAFKKAPDGMTVVEARVVLPNVRHLTLGGAIHALRSANLLIDTGERRTTTGKRTAAVYKYLDPAFRSNPHTTLS
jgi:hypothetical protein